jgi:ABC-type Na+ efflux pump permease subunit
MKYNKLISLGAIIALIGYITSGPLGFMLVKLTTPQPDWVSAAEFAANYSFVQDIPYYLGFLLIGGMLMIAAGYYLNYKEENSKIKFQLLLSLLFATVFAALIFFNYICQTTFIRNLAMHYKPENDSIISTFSMANPMSLSWSIEMWGYGILGIATWLMAGYYKQKNNFIRWLLILNGIVSLLSVAFTISNINWVLTPAGIIAYMLWNILMIVLMIMIYRNGKATQSE